jgi:hypothetical protein
VIETAIPEREDNAGAEVHQRLSVRGSRLGAQGPRRTHRLESTPH